MVAGEILPLDLLFSRHYTAEMPHLEMVEYTRTSRRQVHHELLILPKIILFILLIFETNEITCWLMTAVQTLHYFLIS